MKLKKLKKVLSITLASSMLVSSVPMNTIAGEMPQSIETEKENEQKENGKETAKETEQKEDEKETEKVTEKETEKETEKVTEKETEKDTTGETEKETGDETEQESETEVQKYAVIWGENTFQYNGKNQKPTATFKIKNGKKEKEIKADVKVYADEKCTEELETYADAGTYYAKASHTDYVLTDDVLSFEITEKQGNVSWSEIKFTYNGENQKPTAEFTAWNDKKEEATIKVYADKECKKELKAYAAAGTYYAKATYKNYKPEVKEFVINPYEVTVTAEEEEIYYGEKLPKFTYSVSEIAENLKAEFEEAETHFAYTLADGGDAVNVGQYPIAFGWKSEKDSKSNFKVTFVPAVLKINALPVVITPTADQSKLYGEKDPVYDFEVDFAEKIAFNWNDKFVNNPQSVIKNELAGTVTRENGENVGTYAYKCNENANYVIELAADTSKFTIEALPVVIHPTEGQSKLYGTKDPAAYEYDVTISKSDNLKEGFDEAQVEKELGTAVLERAAGEKITAEGYKYDIAEAFSNSNYDVSVAADAPVFKIKKLTITEVDAIDSRQESFQVQTNLKDEKRNGEVTEVKVEAVKWPEHASITFDKDITAYVAENLGFATENVTVQVKDAVYKQGKQSWTGKLPAGTELVVSIIDKDGNCVSNEVTVEVSQVEVALGDWTGYTTGKAGNFVKKDGKKTEALSIGLTSETSELVKVVYKKTADGKKATDTVYQLLETGTEFNYEAKANNSGTTHVVQSLKASVVDTLNLNCAAEGEKDVKFYVDDQAFPVATAEFANRAKEVTITLPEYGTITNVTIAGAEVAVSQELNNKFTFEADWSGKELVTSGSTISVTYTDEAGHSCTTDTFHVTKSSVSTPINFVIRPELNGAGYLNGRSNTLMISGNACRCEPIKVTVADMTQTVYAEQRKTWSDKNGHWEVLVDMSRLPEGQDFVISAEYADVDGTSYSITAKYDEFCADASVVSPIYEAMTCISGMVEPQTTVALVVNGDTQDYYEIEVDRFGHFVLEDVPMMFAGESFDIYVTDIAGNQSIRHYEIEEPGDPFEVESTVNPLGKFIYSAEAEGSEVYAATPVSAEDFKEEDKELDAIELPLLMGLSYEVGTMTLQKTENGFTVSTEIQVSEDIDPEDYTVENDKLYVYTSKPSIDDLRDCTGKEYAYGEEIVFGENETVWIVDSKDITILADAMMDLELYDYDANEAYEAYQER